MCRVLSYLGQPIVTEQLLYQPDNSFIKQSYHPKYMSHLLNLAGFGIAAWESTSHNPAQPFIYKTPHLPFYDDNLRNFAAKVTPHCLLAHIRGVAYTDKQIVSNQNVHPFVFPGTNVALAHNGSLFNFDKMKYDLLQYVNRDFLAQIHGTTDSEWIYAIFLSQLPNPYGPYATTDLIKAIQDTLKILQESRRKFDIAITSPVNLFITNGEFIAATRFVFDYGWLPENAGDLAHFAYHSLWYTYGESYGYYDNEFKMKAGGNTSIILASEPLTRDTTTWVEVPEYTLIIAELDNNKIKITSQDITL